MCPWPLKTSPLQVNGQELLPAAEYPSQEMVECLRQIGELSDKQTQVEKYVASVAESQQEMAGELAKVEHALPQKVSKEDLNIPEDLQDQLAMLKQGIRKMVNIWVSYNRKNYFNYRMKKQIQKGHCS